MKLSGDFLVIKLDPCIDVPESGGRWNWVEWGNDGVGRKAGLAALASAASSPPSQPQGPDLGPCRLAPTIELKQVQGDPVWAYSAAREQRFPYNKEAGGV